MRDAPLTGAASTCSNWPNELHADRVHLEVTRDANGPGKLASRESLTERRAGAITGIRQHTAKAHTGRHHAIDLSQGDLRLCPCSSIFDRNTRSLQPPPVAGPALGKKKAQRHHYRHFTSCERQ